MNENNINEMAMHENHSDANREVAEEKVQPEKTVAGGVATGYKKIENAIVTGYKKIENGVVTGYKKIETGTVDGFGKVVDKCVELLFAAEGESVEEAKKRLSGKEEK